ncbi:MAG: hypothetical protein AAFY71_11440 [Bacteroidota bacterium]
MASKNVSVKLDFFMQTQELVNWCWASVGTSIALFYEKDSGWTQCKCVAVALEGNNSPCCPPNPESSCNKGYYLVSPDLLGGPNNPHRVGSLVSTGTSDFKCPIVHYPISFEAIRESIDKKEILAFNIQSNQEVQIPGGKSIKISHFLTISGYEIINGEYYVVINDTTDQSMDRVNASIMRYGDFLKSYNLGTYLCSVEYSYFTVRNVVQAPPVNIPQHENQSR